MVRRGWRNLLYLKYATAKAKAKHPLHLEKAAPSGTIENVGCERARLRVLRILASLEGSLRKLRFLRRIASRDEAKKSTQWYNFQNLRFGYNEIASAEYSALRSHFIETKRNNAILAIKMQLSHSK